MKYIVTKEIKSETKVWASFYWQDFMFIIVYFVLSLFLKNKIHTALGTPFVVFSLLMAVILVLPSPTNPKRRTYQAMVLYFLGRNDDIYRFEKEKQEDEKKKAGQKYRRTHSRVRNR